MYGLALAAELPVEQIVREARNATPLDLFRFYAGRLRPDASNPIARMVFAAGQGKDFSDLALPLAIMATDVETGEASVLDCGPVLPAVQASIALPFVARPVPVNDRLYVDGGLVDTAPIHVARKMGADIVIAVRLGFNYMAPRFLRNRPWTRALFERLGQQRRSVSRGLRDQIRFTCRLYAASYSERISTDQAEIDIWPEFNGLNPNSIFGAAFCFDQGVEAGRAALPEIQRRLSESIPTP